MFVVVSITTYIKVAVRPKASESMVKVYKLDSCGSVLRLPYVRLVSMTFPLLAWLLKSHLYNNPFQGKVNYEMIFVLAKVLLVS